MRTPVKILLTFVILVGVSILAQLIAHSLGNRVSTGGIGPFILYPAALAGIVAIWKSKKKQ